MSVLYPSQGEDPVFFRRFGPRAGQAGDSDPLRQHDALVGAFDWSASRGRLLDRTLRDLAIADVSRRTVVPAAPEPRRARARAPAVALRGGMRKLLPEKAIVAGAPDT